jgi:hypothetical protein
MVAFISCIGKFYNKEGAKDSMILLPFSQEMENSGFLFYPTRLLRYEKTQSSKVLTGWDIRKVPILLNVYWKYLKERAVTNRSSLDFL